MGFLAGLGQFAANAVAPTLNVAAARAQAQRAEEDQQRQQMIQALVLQRQGEAQQSKMAEEAASARANDARANMYAHPPAGYKLSEDANGNMILVQYKGDVSSASPSPAPQPQSGAPSPASFTSGGIGGFGPGTPTPPGNPRVVGLGVKAPPKVSLTANDLAQANFTVNGVPMKGFANKQGQYFDANRKPVSGNVAPFAPPVQPALISGSDSTGMHVFRVPKEGGPATEVQGMAPKGASDGRTAAQIETAANQADQADPRMTQFETDYLAGKVTLNPFEHDAAKRMFGNQPELSTAAETYLNHSNPALAQYVRDAKTMAVAERLITPRGGSNMMSTAETALSSIGTGANAGLAQGAQQYRTALRNGLHSAQKSSIGPTGGAPPVAQSAKPASQLTPAQTARAASDPEYAAFLRSQGKMP